jgi:hypothetical protein
MTRTERLLVKARRINDRLAIAVLEGDRTWSPDPETPMLTARLCGVSAPHRSPFVRVGNAA